MKKLVSLLLCMMLMMTAAATAETYDGEIAFPDPMLLEDYLAAFDAFTQELGMPEGTLIWAQMAGEPDTLVLYMSSTGEDLNTCLYTRDGAVEAIEVIYRDYPSEETQEMLQMLSVLAFGPAAMLGGAASVKDAYHLCASDVFSIMPEEWYTDEVFLVGGDLFGKYLAITVEPMGDGSYMHNVELVFADDFFTNRLNAARTGSSPYTPEAFPQLVRMEDYLQATQDVVQALKLLGDDVQWVQDASGIWSLEANREPFGVLIRVKDGGIYALGTMCAEKAEWADQTFEMQMMFAITPLAVLSGLTADEAIGWWLSGVPYDALVQDGSSDYAWSGYFYGIPTHLTVQTDAEGYKSYQLLLLFYGTAETTLPGNPNAQ